MKGSVLVKVLNFVWFQSIWWLVILFQNAAIVPVVVLLVAWVLISPKQIDDIKIMALLFVMGTAIDSLLTMMGLFNFSQQQTLISVLPIPIWLSLLWAAFAGTIYHSLTVFHHRYILAAVAGAIFAPLSYIAGANLGAVSLGKTWLVSYVVIAVVWAGVFPLSFYLSQQLAKDKAKP